MDLFCNHCSTTFTSKSAFNKHVNNPPPKCIVIILQNEIQHLKNENQHLKNDNQHLKNDNQHLKNQLIQYKNYNNNSSQIFKQYVMEKKPEYDFEQFKRVIAYNLRQESNDIIISRTNNIDAIGYNEKLIDDILNTYWFNDSITENC
eukprot:Pgem_evm1s6990